MTHTRFTGLLQLAIVAFFFVSIQTTYADNFSSGGNAFTMEIAWIGNINNVDDTTGNPDFAGAVGYAYRMGTYEVSEDAINKYNNAFGTTIRRR